MEIQEHLDLIRLHSYSLLDEYNKEYLLLRRGKEIRAMLWGILDKAMQIENELGGLYGKRGKNGTKKWDGGS
jgi:hypothetical protein